MAARIRSIFPKKNRISLNDKLLAALLYHLGLSYRRVSFSFESVFSYESVRLWYRKIGGNLPSPDRIQRHLIAVDETKLKIQGVHVFVWSAIDVQRYEVLAIKATASRTELETILFLKELLKYCLNRPIILVDHGPAMQNVFQGLARDASFSSRMKTVTSSFLKSLKFSFSYFRSIAVIKLIS